MSSVPPSARRSATPKAGTSASLATAPSSTFSLASVTSETTHAKPRRAAVRPTAKKGARATSFAALEKARRVDNRVVVIVRPRAPFIDWINSSDPDAPRIPLEQARAEPNIFLLPASDATDAAPLDDVLERDFDRIETTSPGPGAHAETDDWLARHWGTLFDRLLQDWDVDLDDCPQPHSMALFLAWFDVHTHTAVFDYANEPLRYQSHPGREANCEL